MNSDLTEADRRMETVIDAALCELPLRPAPPSLELQVLEELSRRAALPWWRHSFAGWPAIARVGFVLMCMMLVGLAFLAGLWALESLGSPALGLLSMPWARHAIALVDVAAELASLARIVPPTWVYEGLAASVVLYAALFGLGIAAYRTLYLDPNSQVIFRS
jgi:hypothetical protein